MTVAASSKRARRKRKLKLREARLDKADLVAHIELEVCGHLVVARPGRVELAGHRADNLLQTALDIEMYVFQRSREFEVSSLDLGQDFVETLGDLGGLFRRKDACSLKHGDMRFRGFDIVPPEPLVEIDGGINVLHNVGGARGEAAAPHCVGHNGPV